jgi:hypothetical protein
VAEARRLKRAKRERRALKGKTGCFNGLYGSLRDCQGSHKDCRVHVETVRVSRKCQGSHCAEVTEKRCIKLAKRDWRTLKRARFESWSERIFSFHSST